MNLTAVSSEDVRAAQVLTGATFALFLLVGLVPALRAHAARIRLAIVAIYLIGATAFTIHLMAN
jgi:hypothetical protein